MEVLLKNMREICKNSNIAMPIVKHQWLVIPHTTTRIAACTEIKENQQDQLDELRLKAATLIQDGTCPLTCRTQRTRLLATTKNRTIEESMEFLNLHETELCRACTYMQTLALPCKWDDKKYCFYCKLENGLFDELMDVGSGTRQSRKKKRCLLCQDRTWRALAKCDFGYNEGEE